MRVGLIADTHDRLPTFAAALQRFRELSLTHILHAGDLVAPFAARLLAAYAGRTFVTYGNNDGERVGLGQVLPQIQDGPLRVELAGRRILLHHFREWCKPEDVDWAEVVVTGHTHVAGITHEHGRLFVNPGECCGWVHGRCTAAVLDLNTLNCELFEVNES